MKALHRLVTPGTTEPQAHLGQSFAHGHCASGKSSSPHLPLCCLCFLLFNFGSMCASCAQTRILRAPSRVLRSSPAPRDAFTGGSVRQCVPPWRDAANFSREAFGLGNSPFHQKTSVDAFLSSFLCDLIRVISTDFDQIYLPARARLLRSPPPLRQGAVVKRPTA